MSIEKSLQEQKQAIWNYILSNHVLSMSACNHDDIWSANMFYAAHPLQDSVYIMTSMFTNHGQLMLQNAMVSGTISDQTKDVEQLKGIQFQGLAAVLTGTEEEHALSLYAGQFPVAKKMKETVWKITFTVLKYTDNSLGFGTKMIWQNTAVAGFLVCKRKIYYDQH